MRHSELIVGLDIGTTKTCCVIAERRDEGIDIVGVGTHPSRGMRRGVVVDIEATVHSIRRAVEEAEIMGNCEVNAVYVGIAGSHIDTYNEEGRVVLKGREVRESDVKRVIEQAQAIAIPPDREIIHVIAQEFVIDGQEGIVRPVGMSGMRLTAHVHIVTAAVASAQNIIKCCNRAGLHVIDIVLEPLASAEAALSVDEKQLGVAMLDIGGGTTDLAIFHDGAIQHSKVLGLGGYHLTNDAAVGLRTPFDQAERVKRRFGCASKRLLSSDELLIVPGLDGRAPREISRKDLADFLEPRVEEILTLARNEVHRVSSLTRIPCGLVLTGGSSSLDGICELAEEIFEVPVRRGVPRAVGGLADRVQGPEFSTGVGLALWGTTRAERPRFRISDRSAFRRVRERMRSWLYGEAS
jgi:cell division protein FtsA